MKKTFKRLGAMFLAMVMAVSVLCTGAFADESDGTTTTSNSITITTTSSGHTYEAYQVFAGTLSTSESTTTLGITGWGTDVNASELVTALQTASNDTSSKLHGKFANILKKGNTESGTDITDSSSVDVAQNVADSIKSFKDKSDEAKAFAKIVAAHLSSTKTKFTEQKIEADSEGNQTTTGYKAENLAAGYYLVKDSSESSNIDAYTDYILQVVGETKVTPKSGVPTVDKKVQNTTADEKTGKDATTASYGDTVTFTLTGTLPDNYADYEKYELTFHDTLASALSYNKDTANVKVYYQKYNTTDKTWGELTEIPQTQGSNTNYTIVNPTTDNKNHTVDFVFSDVKSLVDSNGSTISLGAHDRIVVTYDATVNNTAGVGSSANNFNKVYLEYSNDPNKEDNKGNTPEDEVKVYVFQIEVDKVITGTTTPLENAKFRLYYTTTDTSKEPAEVTKHYAKVDSSNKLEGWTTAESDASTLVTGSDGKISVVGLNAGTYYLEETEAPAGYNKLTAPVKLEITATMGTGEQSTTLTSLTAKLDEKEMESNSITLTDGKIAVKVENTAGSNLPSTGGMGTKLFYTIGGLLMAGAAIVLVIKKRRSTAE